MRLRTAATHHRALEPRHIATEPLLFLPVSSPLLAKRIQSHIHNPTQHLALALALDALDEFVENPRPGEELLFVSVRRGMRDGGKE